MLGAAQISVVLLRGLNLRMDFEGKFFIELKSAPGSFQLFKIDLKSGLILVLHNRIPVLLYFAHQFLGEESGIDIILYGVQILGGLINVPGIGDGHNCLDS